MQNCGTTLNIQRPVLPFFCLPSQTLPRRNLPGEQKLKKIAPLPIGRKIKSFKIKTINSSALAAKTLNLDNAIKLPNFVHSPAPSLNIYSESVVAIASCVSPSSQPQLRKVAQPKSPKPHSSKRFWWHWLLSVGSTISVLTLSILLQTPSHARNLLETVRIYIELNSQQVMSLPDSGRTNLYNNQASPFNRAIRQAREIEADSPFYEQTQADITRWSEVIFDIARGRASQEDFAGAIAAAQLVPQDKNADRLIAQQATKAVEQWQLKARKQNLYQDSLAQAKKSIDPGQASSYNLGISILRQISPGVEEYQEAQNLIRQWSKQILLIANHRAAKGNFQQAIEAAVLVPQDSPYSQVAKNSLNRWKNQVKVVYLGLK